MKSDHEKQKPVLEGFFSWPPEKANLIGSKCKACNTISFPKRTYCPNPYCDEKEMAEILLSRKGRLWSFTVHYYEPPPPFKYHEPFEPFGIGIIELPEGIKILSMLTTRDSGVLKIGMDMELVVDKMYEDEEGNDCMTWKFMPV